VVEELGPLVPLVAAPVTLTTEWRGLHPWCLELHDVAGPVGRLVRKDPTTTHALCAGNAWTFTTHRARWSWTGLADEVKTGDTVAAYYPAFRAGGAIALHHTHYRLTLPWLRKGWWLRDIEGQPIAVVYEKPKLSIELRQDSAQVGTHLTLVLLLALWVNLVTPRFANGSAAGP
jgi:hypothetical protein